MSHPIDRFRRVAEYAADLGAGAAFPNFHESDHGRGPVGGVVFLDPGATEWRDVPAAELGRPAPDDLAAIFRGADAYALRQGFAGAVPNGHSADHGRGLVFGINLIRPGAGVRRDVPLSMVPANPVPRVDDVPTMMRVAADAAARWPGHAGFPTFRAGGAPGTLGAVVLPPSSFRWRDVVLADLYPKLARCLVVLGRFSDVPPPRPADWYREYVFARGNGSLTDYYLNATNLAVRPVGDVVGWLDLGRTAAEHDAGPGGHRQRRRAFGWALDAARRAGARPEDYPHVLVVVNRHTDFGGLDPGQALLPDAANSDPFFVAHRHSFWQHEFGHLLGLPDSQGPAGSYDDPYCIMSFAHHAHVSDRTIAGVTAKAGPGLDAVLVRNLGGLRRHRVDEVTPTRAGTPVTLHPQGFPERQQVQAVWFTSPLDRTTYLLSWRVPRRWDAGLRSPVVLLHEVPDGRGIGRIVPGPPDTWGLARIGDTVTSTDGRYVVSLDGIGTSPDGLFLAHVTVRTT